MTRPRRRARPTAILLALALQTAAFAANPTIYLQSTPDILTMSQTAPLTIEATMTNEVASVTFAHGQDAPRPLRNDGQGGDRVAGDRVFTIRFDAAEVQAWYNLLPIRRRAFSIGLLRPVNAAGTLLSGPTVNVAVKAEGIPRVPLTPLSLDAQYTPHIFNVSMPLSFFVEAQTSAATQALYSYFRDSFEFVNLVFDGNVFKSSAFSGTQEQISGLGRALFPLSPDHGSVGKLEGILNLYGAGRLDITASCGGQILHELGHRWINALHGGFDDPHGSHWPLSALAGGIMGYSAHDGSGNGGGIVPGGKFVPAGNDLVLVPDRSCPKYNDMELYLMGLRDPNAVAPQLVAVDQNQPIPSGAQPRIFGPFQNVSVANAIAVNGARVPSFQNAPKQFRVATILVTPERLASPDMMDWIESQAVYLDSAFFDATGGAGRLRSEIASARIGFPIPGPRIVGVRNAASLMSGPVSPGSIIRIDGSGLGPAAEVTARLSTNAAGPTELASTRLTFNGQAAALLSVSATEITAVVPSALTLVPKSVNIQVERLLSVGTLLSNVVTMPRANASTAVFSRNGLGAGPALAFNQDGTANTPENPALGNTTAEIFVNGAGPFLIALPDGSIVPPSSTPIGIAHQAEVFVDGTPAAVVSATNIPGDLASKVRIRFKVPLFFDGSLTRTLSVRIDGVMSPESVHMFAQRP